MVDVYIRYLRSKIDDALGVKTIHTVRGVGYGFRDRGRMTSENERVRSTARTIGNSWFRAATRDAAGA